MKDIVKDKKINDIVSSILKDFKKDILNTKLKCKGCKSDIREVVLNNNFVCPICYFTIFEKLLDDNKVTLYDFSTLEKLMLLKKSSYKGRKPEFSYEYYDLESKIDELNIELGVSITDGDYIRCDILKNAINELELKKSKLRSDING